MAVTERHETVRYEQTDINPRGVLYVGFGVLLATMVIIALLHFLFTYMSRLEARESPLPLPIAAHGHPLPPEPRLQESPHQDWVAVRAAAESELNSYQWIDRQKGIVSIPIDRAIDLIAQRGIPKSPPPASQFEYYRPQAGDRLTGFEERKEPQP